MQKRAWAVLLLMTSCAGPRSCVPNFKLLKTAYPHVLYHGPKEPSEVVLKKYPPANWTPLSQISKKAQGAVIVSEDWAFYTHPGYDEKQLKEVIEQAVETQHMKRGASTITQQVVKNIYLSKEKSVIRKARELWIATKIEKVLGKNRILELYFNVAEWGEGVFGIGQAAHFYFHKNPSELSAKEGAFLAMLLPSPKKYAISYRHGELTPFARKIIRSVLNKMVMAHYISSEERDQEWRTPLSFEKNVDLTIPSDESLNSDDDEVDGDPNAEKNLPTTEMPTATPDASSEDAAPVDAD